MEHEIEKLLDNCGSWTPDAPPSFKLGLADVIRTELAGTRSCCIDGDPDFPHESDFLQRGSKLMGSQNPAEPLLKAGRLGYNDMRYWTVLKS